MTEKALFPMPEEREEKTSRYEKAKERSSRGYFSMVMEDEV